VFTRLLVGLDGSPNADEALEQAVHLGLRFKAKLVVAHIRETHSLARRDPDSVELLQRAEERVKDAGLQVETILKHGSPDTELAFLAGDVDTVLVGRRGSSSPADVLGRTVTSLRRPEPTCAPANRASHCVRSMTRATAAPGVPGSRCVTNLTPCSDSMASASPMTIVPMVGSTVAWITCTVLCVTLAKRATRASARCAVSLPS